MTDKGTSPTLFSRNRSDTTDQPPADPVKAPFGWTRDRYTREWRPKKRPAAGGHGGAGKTLASQGITKPKSKAKPYQSTGRPPGRPRKHPAPLPSKPLRVVTPQQPPPAADEDQDEGGFPFAYSDPDPAWQSAPASDQEIKPTTGKGASEQLHAEVRAWIAIGYSLPADVLATVDPYCFGPLVEPDTSVGIIDAVSDIVMGSPRVAEWVASKAGLAPWLKLGYAFKPVFVNAWKHHVTKSVEVHVDREAMTYEVTKKDYSQYPAA